MKVINSNAIFKLASGNLASIFCPESFLYMYHRLELSLTISFCLHIVLPFMKSQNKNWHCHLNWRTKMIHPTWAWLQQSEDYFFTYDNIIIIIWLSFIVKCECFSDDLEPWNSGETKYCLWSTYKFQAERNLNHRLCCFYLVKGSENQQQAIWSILSNLSKEVNK